MAKTGQFVPLGGDLRGYYAAPPGAGPFPGVLLFQEAFGINGYIESEVQRLAEHGYAAIAPDLFRGEIYAYSDFATKVLPKLQAFTREGLLADIDASLGYLEAQANVRHGKYGAVGFCMGGRLAVLTALARPQKIAAAASFYGGGIAPDKPRHSPPLLGELGSVQGELLLIYGADDEGIAPQEHARIVEELSREKKRYTLRVYAGAGHGFASKDRESYRPQQAESGWAETLALFERTLETSG